MLTIGGITFKSRLFLGTGKFSSASIMNQAIEASGTEMVTVALRRIDLEDPQDDIMSHLDQGRYTFLPNTSGARNSSEAIRLAHLARAASGSKWLKLEDRWTRFELDLRKKNLSRICSLCLVVAQAEQEDPKRPITFYVDSIYFE